MASGPGGVTLIADIGGTNARFAMVHGDGAVRDVRVLACDDYADLIGAAEAYLTAAALPDRPRRGAFAVASPVLDDHVSMTNRAWSFSTDRVRRRLGLEDLKVINDFAAVALALPHLGSGDRVQIGGGRVEPGAAAAVIGPGTGLGVSALIPHPGGWTPLATEGGHVTMAAATDREADVLARLRGFGHVSAERVISGPGLVTLYRTLAALDGQEADKELTPADITGRAVGGTCPVSAEALAMFSAMLGTVAANLALNVDARGGVYIAGGIVPRLGATFADSGFRARFEDKGRYSDYLAAIPTFVLSHEMPAFVGLAHLATEIYIKGH